jgi:hypothetical protein
MATSILLVIIVLPQITPAQTPIDTNLSNKKPKTKGSGIEGIVTIGPIFPIERPGVINFRPYQATITVIDENGKVVTQFQSGEDGKFQVRLKPGVYLIRPESPNRFPAAEEQKVIVDKKEYTEVNIRYNSGIR